MSSSGVALRELTRHWIALNDLFEGGRGASEESQALRDRCDPYYRAISAGDLAVFHAWLARVDRDGVDSVR